MDLSDEDKKLLREMREHLGDLHQKWRDDPDYDGYCKSNEGYVGLLFRLKNWHEAASKQDYIDAVPEISMVEVYSYLFGPHRLHSFDTIKDAHKEVMSWSN